MQSCVSLLPEVLVLNCNLLHINKKKSLVREGFNNKKNVGNFPFLRGNLFMIFFQHPSVKFTSFLPQFTRYGTGEKGVQWCSNSIFFWVFKGYFDL